MLLQKLFQGEILAVVIIYLLRLVREQKNRVSKVAFMESIIWKQLGSHKNFFWPQITSTLISCAYLQQLLKEYQGSLGRGSRRGQPVARAKSAQQCGRRCDANRLGVSYLGLAGWIRTSRSGVLINCFLPKNISKAQYYRFMARTKDRWKILLVLGHVRIFSRIDQWRSWTKIHNIFLPPQFNQRSKKIIFHCYPLLTIDIWTFICKYRLF